MQCPYCGKEAELGIIQNQRELVWTPGEKRRLFIGSFYEGSVVLSEQSIWRGSAVRAYLCRDCRKIVIDCADPHSDLNED